jgi:hemerythrin-like domain-containing protein
MPYGAPILKILSQLGARRDGSWEAALRESKMTYFIEVLRQEHRNIERLLCVLERELSVFDRGERPDYEAVVAVIDCFKDYPDSCHHPKEDMIVEKLKARDPGAAATIGDLAGEHQEGARRLRRVAQAVERVLSDQDLVRQNVDNIIRDFINHERQHMAMEERIVFPAALDALRPEDWADIALRLADRDDPFYQAGFEQKFNRLRRNILKMEEEAEAERSN